MYARSAPARKKPAHPPCPVYRALTPTPRRLPERSDSDGPALTADDLSYADVPRPFKNPHHVRAQTGGAGKRSKSLKQILVMERERVDRVLEGKKRRVDEVGETEGMEVDPERGGEGTGRERERERAREERLQEAFGEVVSYASVEAPPSLMPQKKYCDVTGLEAKYVDPKSTLRYHNPEVYEVIKSFQPAVIQAYLAVRGQGVVLR
ncbi:hypothetical protein JCM21900_004008 [Sporobolomyces salmonicolor]